MLKLVDQGHLNLSRCSISIHRAPIRVHALVSLLIAHNKASPG